MAAKKYPLSQKAKDGCTIELNRIMGLRQAYAERIKTGGEAERDFTTEVRTKLLPEGEKGD